VKLNGEDLSHYLNKIELVGCLQCFDAVGWAAEKASGRKKIWGDDEGGHWLVRMEWRPPRWSVCLPPLICPCTVKSRSFLLAPADPCGPEKMAIKRLWCGSRFRKISIFSQTDKHQFNGLLSRTTWVSRHQKG